MFRKTITVVTGLLAVVAAVICYNLLNKHVSGSSGMAWFDAGCSDDAKPGDANCAKVLASPYSYFPPKNPDKPDKVARFPTAFLGLVYYSTLLVWLIGVGAPTFDRRRWHLAPLGFVGAGLAGSGYFTFIMYRVLGEWCPWCLVTHGLNLLIALGFVLLWPRKSESSGLSQPTDAGRSALDGIAVTRREQRPSLRAVVMTTLVIAVVLYAHLNSLGLKTWRHKALAADTEYKAILAAVNRIKGDSDRLYKNWQLSEKREISRREDDPVRYFSSATAGPVLDVVVFSDFECPSCQRFAEFFEHKVPPLFGGQIRLTFKHYPIDQACNPRAAQTMHKQACFGAALAEGARLLGGNDGFWKTHDFLYKNRNELAAGKITPDRVAGLLGAETADLVKAAQSPQFAERVLADIESARSCEIRGTPSVFIEGKNVDPLAVMEIGFWDKIAEMFWRNAKTPRPASTRPPDAAATPNIQAPTAAP